ncbi:MAG: hypothetical protein ACI4M1_04050 [Christensenellales bacterium]|nr:MAG TPA: hypothetical protein [Caudoviricetes sp.]
MTDTDNIKKQYESYKKELDTINKRYSETYIEPETDMPQSLGLSKIEYETPSDEQLRKKAEISLSADKQAAAEKISRDTSEKIKKQQTLKDKAFSEAVKQLIDIDREETETKREKENDALARNLARSSIASEGIKQVESYADEMRAQTERERDDAIDAISREIDALKRDASRALSENEKVFLSKLEAETERLRQAAEKEKREAEKYNNSIAEKEAEYGKELEKRAKELERQEWERLARLAEIKNKQGENAVQSMKQKEILTATKAFYDSLSPADALGLFLSDTGMQSTLGDDYVWFLDYLQKRKNA